MRLITWAWWKAALIRAGRTALVIVIPYAGTILYTEGDWIIALSAAGFGALASVITALISIPAEAQGQETTWWYAIFERSIKTAGQALLTLFGTATIFEQVNWAQAPQLVGTAILGSILIGVLGFIPNASTPLAQAAIPTLVTGEDGQAAVAETPIVAVAASADPNASVKVTGDPLQE